jgi:hypothetical protein
MGWLRASIPGLIRWSHFFWSKISLHGLHWFTQVYIRLPPDVSKIVSEGTCWLSYPQTAPWIDVLTLHHCIATLQQQDQRIVQPFTGWAGGWASWNWREKKLNRFLGWLSIDWLQFTPVECNWIEAVNANSHGNYQSKYLNLKYYHIIAVSDAVGIASKKSTGVLSCNMKLVCSGATGSSGKNIIPEILLNLQCRVRMTWAQLTVKQLQGFMLQSSFGSLTHFAESKKFQAFTKIMIWKSIFTFICLMPS